MSAFIDTSAFYAVLDRDDGNHAAAREVWFRLLSEHVPLLTSNYVLVETYALLRARLGMRAVRRFANDVGPVVQMTWIRPEDHDAALQAFLVSGRQSTSLVDCASFQIMRRMGISEAFAFDRHFRQQGFRVIVA